MLVRSLVCAVLLLSSAEAAAAGLREAFEAALALDPDLATLEGRRSEIEARWRGSEAFLPGPAAASAGYVTDELTEKEGYGDLELELGVPVWLPGQARSQRMLAEAEQARLAAQLAAARLAVAATVRDAYWAWASARASLDAARDAARTTAALARDVTRQARAGQVALVEELLARADTSEAEARRVEAETAEREARSVFVTLTGREPPPDAREDLRSSTDVVHPRVQAARLAQDVGRAALRVAEIEDRDSPELALVYQREREARSRSWDDRVGVRLRLPFPHPPRNAERRSAAIGEMGAAAAELVAAERALRAERERAGAALEEARVVERLADQRYRALAEAAALADRSFRGGEAGLGEVLRLRAALAGADADRRRSAVAFRQAVSRMNQALGYEP